MERLPPRVCCSAMHSMFRNASVAAAASSELVSNAAVPISEVMLSVVAVAALVRKPRREELIVFSGFSVCVDRVSRCNGNSLSSSTTDDFASGTIVKPD